MKSLAEVHPELIPDWSEKNQPLTPDQVSYGSNKKVWWKGVCGHEWVAAIKNWKNGHGCPFCSGNRVLRGFNDLESQYPKVAKEWSRKYNPMKPYEVTARSPGYAWWKCRKCGFEWEARIADRTEGHGCPACAGEILVPGINDLQTLYPELASEWSEKNDPLNMVTVWPKSETRIWWKCHTCGYEWKVQIRRRVRGEGLCPVCVARARQIEVDRRHKEKDFEEKRAWETLIHYLNEIGEKIIIGEEDQIGVPLGIYLPDRYAAIELESRKKITRAEYKREYTKNDLCLKRRIRMIRIQHDTKIVYPNCICIRTRASWSSFDQALKALMYILQEDIEIDSKKDRKKILEGYLEINEMGSL